MEANINSLRYAVVEVCRVRNYHEPDQLCVVATHPLSAFSDLDEAVDYYKKQKIGRGLGGTYYFGYELRYTLENGKTDKKNVATVPGTYNEYAKGSKLEEFENIQESK